MSDAQPRNAKILAGYGLVVLVAVALDQWIKFLVETRMAMHERIDILPSLALFRTHNTGIAFSLLSDFGSIGLVVLTAAVTLGAYWIMRSEPFDVELDWPRTVDGEPIILEDIALPASAMLADTWVDRPDPAPVEAPVPDRPL